MKGVCQCSRLESLVKKSALWVFYGLLGHFLVFIAGRFFLPGSTHVSRSTLITH
jgi:hypothetical protein